MLLNAGVSLVQTDFIETKLLNFEIEKVNDLLLFTSQNAVESALQNSHIELLKQRNAICVGIKTKALLEESGFQVLACKDYAAELAKIITSNYKHHSITFLAGNIRRDTLPDALKNAKMKFDEIRAYQTILNPQRIKAIVDGILFFSPSGIESYTKLNKITDEVCFCIGTTTADALQDITENYVIANQPTVENTIIQCINYYK